LLRPSELLRLDRDDIRDASDNGRDSAAARRQQPMAQKIDAPKRQTMGLEALSATRGFSHAGMHRTRLQILMKHLAGFLVEK
jgi:hypothetical protein